MPSLSGMALGCFLQAPCSVFGSGSTGSYDSYDPRFAVHSFARATDVPAGAGGSELRMPEVRNVNECHVMPSRVVSFVV